MVACWNEGAWPMSMMPSSNPNTAGMRNYSPGPIPGVPTSEHDAYPAGATYSRARNALILGILAIPLSIVAGIPAIWMGLHAKRTIDASEGTLGGRNAALAGIVLGSLSVVMFVAFLVGVYL